MEILWYIVAELTNYQHILFSTSENNPLSYEATKAVEKKAQKKIWGFFATALVAS